MFEGHNNSAVMALTMMDTKVYPTAVCNDGTPGGYYFTPFSDPAFENTWVIFLPGGGQCFDYESCTTRDKSLMSSKNFDSTMSKAGFMDASEKNSPLFGANKAALGYCSSDGYMGDVGASSETWNYHFRGQALIRAMISELKLQHKFNDATKVVFSGCSAGGRGVMTNIDSLISEKYLPDFTIGLLDSPYYVDIVPYDTAAFSGFQYEEQ